MRAESRGTTTPSGRQVKEGHFILPVLSTYAKENPPQLEMAGNLIRDTAVRAAAAFVGGGTGGGGEIGGGRKRPSSSAYGKKKRSPLMSDASQSSIQYLACLADYDLLFDTALRSYDLEMAGAVGRGSQMDPRV